MVEKAVIFYHGRVSHRAKRQIPLVLAAAGLLAAAGAAPPQAPGDGRLRSRPVRPTAAIGRGTVRLGLGEGRDGSLYVPSSYRPDTPATLVVVLHGAGGSGQNFLGTWRDVAERRGLIVLAPDSRASTWDLILGGYGPDIEFIDRALAWVFERCTVDPSRVYVSGFSDGASYALSLGLINGDLFSKVVAFSPGFVVADQRRGKPAIFISHGLYDRVLPIDQTGRRLMATLKQDRYQVTFREYLAGHRVPAEIRDAAFRWMVPR